MSNKSKHYTGVVYSTNRDYEYQKEEKPEQQTLPNQQQQLRVRIEKNHRGGKTVTIVDGFAGKDVDLEELGKALKQKCGTGGSVKDGIILVQGEMKMRVVKLLIEMGYKNSR